MHISSIRRILAFLCISAVIPFTSCHKKTSTDFRLGRYSYAPGETLDLINLSPKKRNQVWEIKGPDGESDTIVSGQAPQLTLDILAEDGIYTVQAYDNIKEMDKDLSITSAKTFKVSADRGAVTIYSNQFSTAFDLTIDGQSIQGEHGTTYELPVGMRIIKASATYPSGATYSLDTTVTITPQSSTHLQLD